ncbi:lysoplasmalogenase [Gelidibacter maritimus]|uniref:Lysoplasmalogenase n=1 Tax=Gelidibacter maritimus TaxID=2761487 RepID=A0A7W2M7U6_9FLAO|nr:lysoplasmalogenase [Gelidibacter maritimus]MBA6154336.1 lysoplasmalogenase [Gelidibacter maritimus]
MLTKTEKQFTILFILLLIAELICVSFESLSTWRYLTKPSLLSALIVYFYLNSRALTSKTKITTLIALIFSLMGDVFLMFVDQSPNFFMLGLASFFLAHVFYILIFWKRRNSKINPVGFLAILIVYAIGLFYLLKNSLGNLLIPVIFYIIIILSMAITAFLRQGKVSKISFVLVFLGAILFVISDSILALNKFYMPLRFSSVSIMLSYALAQYFIVMGLLKQS